MSWYHCSFLGWNLEVFVLWHAFNFMQNTFLAEAFGRALCMTQQQINISDFGHINIKFIFYLNSYIFIISALFHAAGLSLVPMPFSPATPAKLHGMLHIQSWGMGKEINYCSLFVVVVVNTDNSILSVFNFGLPMENSANPTMFRFCNTRYNTGRLLNLLLMLAMQSFLVHPLVTHASNCTDLKEAFSRTGSGL